MTKRRDIKNITTELASVREQFPPLHEEREEMQRSAVAEEEIEPRIDQLLRSLGSEWLKFQVSGLCAPGGEEGWQPRPVTLHPDDVLGLVATVARDSLRSVLLENAKRHLAKHGPGLPAHERAARIAKIDGELWCLGREEERLIEEAASLGIELERRGTADPRCVLFVEPREAA